MTNDLSIMISDDAKDFSKCFFWLMRRTEISQQDKIVYSRLRNISKKCGVYEVSQAFLAHECGCSVQSIKRSIKNLTEVELISKIRNGKKMYNHYNCHVHPWMEEDVKFNESEVTNTYFTSSEVTNTNLVKYDPGTSIYKEQNKKQNNTLVSLNSSSRAVMNKQIQEVFVHWQKETKQPGCDLTPARKNKIKSALQTGVKYENYTKPLSVEQIKELISLSAGDEWLISKGLNDLSTFLTQKKLTSYIEGRMKKSANNDSNSTLTVIEL